MHILHLSALPVWSLDGKGGMPSLQETLRGHVSGGHHVMLILPKFNLFKDIPTEVQLTRTPPGISPSLAALGTAVPRFAYAWLGVSAVARNRSTLCDGRSTC